MKQRPRQPAAVTHRLVWLLLAGVVGFAALPTLALRALGEPNGLWTIPAWLRIDAGGDSWGAIEQALRHLDTKGTVDFYKDLYHSASHQFIYSPLSLVFYRLTQYIPGIDWYSQDAMNRVSWPMVPATIVVLALTIGYSLPRLGRLAAPRPMEWAAIGLAAALAVLLSWPIMRGWHNGQIQTWLNLLGMLALLCWLLGGRAVVGVLLGLACIVKPQLGVVVLWAALRGQWAVLAGCAVVVAGFAVASLAAYGLGMHLDYVALMGLLSRRGESFVDNQSVNGLLNRLWHLGPNLTFDGTHRSMVFDPWVYGLTMASSAAMLLAALAWRTQQTALLGTLDLATLLLVSTIAAPVAYTHHYGVILPVFWLALLGLVSARERRVLPYALLACAYLPVSNSTAVTAALADTAWNPLQSLPFFGALLLLGLLFWTRARLEAQAHAHAHAYAHA
ncbi:MAG: hypothetical protein ABS99_03130 [Acetobacteraceae bacterium SCN 69-10]|nr:DUF2029 domain-containing protein [Rhodospirillales bacterium]ODU60086.1 MAG: hypothetical protein ABS99_03130 [Acetobacteraceae bacterium SCN 69-10]OJY64807.1 MAG: hypothetical protein BGP12_03455 [Rhodospirillales bacterium 70-18]